MKIQFKINRTQLIVWIAFLIATWNEEEKQENIWQRMLFCSLSSLLHKLKLQSVLMKDKYKFSIDASDALAFVAHAQQCDASEIHAEDQIIINGLIGIIDKKTR